MTPTSRKISERPQYIAPGEFLPVGLVAEELEQQVLRTRVLSSR